jgi:hypothetical protein
MKTQAGVKFWSSLQNQVGHCGVSFHPLRWQCNNQKRIAAHPGVAPAYAAEAFYCTELFEVR